MNNPENQSKVVSNILELKDIPEINISLKENQSKQKKLVRVIAENSVTYGLLGILLGAVFSGIFQWLNNQQQKETQLIVKLLEFKDKDGAFNAQDFVRGYELLSRGHLIGQTWNYQKGREEMDKYIQNDIVSGLISAVQYETLGFQELINKNLSLAQEYFNNAYEAYPTYHNVDEINKLIKDKKKVNNWGKEIYCPIVNKYYWGMPNEIKIEMKKQGKCP